MLTNSLLRRWSARHGCRGLATAAERPRIPQTVIEKVVQKYAVGLSPDKVVKAGDYVMIRPEHVMTHDNTGPVISKYVTPPFARLRLMQVKVQVYWGDPHTQP